MLNYIQIIILGIIQGVSEFLPISSSAHLIIFRDLFGIGQKVIIDNLELSFDIALHFGTLIAILIYFFKDFWTMFINFLKSGVKTKEGKLFLNIIIATIPAAIIGLLFDEIVEVFFRKQFLIIALALILMGIIISYADQKSKSNKSLFDIEYKNAILIGFSQVLALVPGFSRSGTTIASSRFLGLDKESSAKFSFYLATPVIAGATLLQFTKKSTIVALSQNLNIFLIGTIVSFLVGLLTINFLLKYLRKNDFKIFMYYRILMGITVMLYLLFIK